MGERTHISVEFDNYQPLSVFPRSCLSLSDDSDPKAQGIPRILSRAVCVFSSSAALFQKLRHEKQFSSGTDPIATITL
ncbi:hypothetical protein MTR_0100s0170 [Medicago truncatula]|uniref:Uncharacterized protein n=1 Tax=Medicago truncatula TaxID=3880 RepID=A0A072TGR5_MEDTR|nr:hypothetical protein MTR_0100s0170 [Medicago truncatula]